jgi:hypothetical protein
MNGWARLAMVFVVCGGVWTLGAGVWAFGLMNHGGRQYGWILVGSLALSTKLLYEEVGKNRGGYSGWDLLGGVATCYFISSVGLAVTGGFADNDLTSAMIVAAFLLGPLLLVVLIAWIVAGFARKPTGTNTHRGT